MAHKAFVLSMDNSAGDGDEPFDIIAVVMAETIEAAMPQLEKIVTPLLKAEKHITVSVDYKRKAGTVATWEVTPFDESLGSTYTYNVEVFDPIVA